MNEKIFLRNGILQSSQIDREINAVKLNESILGFAIRNLRASSTVLH